MPDHYLVEIDQGPAWDRSTSRRGQAGWDEHAAFMEDLVVDGFVVLGGPVGNGIGTHVLLVVNATDEAAVRSRLASDPWADDLLTIRSVQPWTVWLRAPEDDPEELP